MAQDSDVARVAAALKAPGLRYRSFGNEPVRIAPGEVSNVAETYPLLGAAMEVASDFVATEGPVEPAVERDPYVETLAESLPEYVAPPEPEPLAPPPAPRALPPEEPPPPAPVDDLTMPPMPIFAALAAMPPAAAAAPAPSPVVAPAPPMAPLPLAAPALAPAYSLLESLGRQADLGPSMATSGRPAPPMPGLTAFGAAPPAPNPSGTFANLLAGAAPAAPIGMPAMLGNPAGHGWPQPPRGNAALLPAAAVTVPLNDVMRLIAVGAPAPASPFDAFRAAMGASAVR